MPVADLLRRAIERVKQTIITIIRSTNNLNALNFMNQRKIDRCQNGVLWMTFWTGSLNTTPHAFEFWYSTDDGETWSENVTGRISYLGAQDTVFSAGQHQYMSNISFFIDLDDYAHVVYTDTNAANPNLAGVLYRRGTPNLDRTAWTWSSPVVVPDIRPPGFLGSLHRWTFQPDIVVHREGLGWTAHVIYALPVIGQILYNKIHITSGGSFSRGSEINLANTNHWDMLAGPSIDFHHTGDGKTVLNDLPHLYVVYTMFQTGSGKGIRFRKATYLSETWTWGIERAIDTSVWADGPRRLLSCLFDGERVIIAGNLRQGAAGGAAVYVSRLWERNEIDTTTTLRSTNNELLRLYGNITYDAFGNVYGFGMIDGRYRLTRWERFSGEVTVDDITSADAPTLGTGSMKRGHSNGRLDFVYNDHNPNTNLDNLVYGGVDV